MTSEQSKDSQKIRWEWCCDTARFGEFLAQAYVGCGVCEDVLPQLRAKYDSLIHPKLLRLVWVRAEEKGKAADYLDAYALARGDKRRRASVERARCRIFLTDGQDNAAQLLDAYMAVGGFVSYPNRLPEVQDFYVSLPLLVSPVAFELLEQPQSAGAAAFNQTNALGNIEKLLSGICETARHDVAARKVLDKIRMQAEAKCLAYIGKEDVLAHRESALGSLLQKEVENYVDEAYLDLSDGDRLLLNLAYVPEEDFSEGQTWLPEAFWASAKDRLAADLQEVAQRIIWRMDFLYDEEVVEEEEYTADEIDGLDDREFLKAVICGEADLSQDAKAARLQELLVEYEGAGGEMEGLVLRAMVKYLRQSQVF